MVITAWIQQNMDSYKVWMVSREIFVHSSAKTISSSFSDDGRRYRLLTCFYKMHHKFPIILRSGDCDGEIKCSTSLECSSWHNFSSVNWCISILKIAFPPRNRISTIGLIWSDNLLKNSLDFWSCREGTLLGQQFPPHRSSQSLLHV